MKPFMILTVFLACVILVGPILLIPVGIYLLVGMAIFVIGTWPAAGGNKSIWRRCQQKLVFKDERIVVTLAAAAGQIPPLVEAGDPWNIVLVIDKSSSMMGTPLGNAKIAAKNLVSSTPRDFRYGIVEFHDYAHIRSQLTTNTIKLKLSISRLVSEGGTAINEGLRLAGQVLKPGMKPGQKNAVILLSDGGSDHESALKEAGDLKEQGVEIYAIGLGACDEELMGKIATDSEKYFYARSPKELKILYHTIGRIIQNARGKEVEITEYPNVQNAPFHIVGWGDIQPSTFDSGTGTGTGTGTGPVTGTRTGKGLAVEWYLPTLQNEPAGLDYSLMSRCYGWYRVSEERAQLKLKDQVDKPYIFTSNKGPYVLIIPRFFLWQVFWFFLNPLFWMVFQKWGCQAEEISEIGAYVPPQRVSIPQPELLPTLNPPFKLTVAPTLAIGAGYGGINALVHLKRLLWEHNADGEVAKKVVIAAVDTVNPWYADIVKSGHIGLDPGEKFNIHAPVSAFIRAEAEREEPHRDYTWINARQKRAEGSDYDIGTGTDLDRSIGRLMILHHRKELCGEGELNTGGSTANLKTLIQELHRSNPGETMQICIAGTLSGGTSGGVIPELCYTARRILEELDIVGVGITLFLMDYQVEMEDPRRDHKKPVVQANKDGFINELARFFTARANLYSPLPGELAVNRWYDRIIWVDKKPDTTNALDLYPQCAVLMYSWAVEKEFRDLVQKNTRDVHDGLLVHRFETDTAFFFKRTLENYYSVRLLLTVIGDHLLGLAPNPGDYSVKSVDREKIKTYIDDALESLYKNPGWKGSLPLLLKNRNMIINPQRQHISTFLSHPGMIAVVESASQDSVNKFLDNEESAFDKLLSSWIEGLLSTHKDERIITPREKKLPAAYFSLQRLKENLAVIRQMVEEVPGTAGFLLKKRCQTVAEMCARYTVVIEQWSNKLGRWWVLLGDGNENLTGVCRVLNFRLHDLEKSLQSTGTYTTPRFVFSARVEDEIYRKYFAQLEHRVLEQLHWQVEVETRKIRFMIVDNEKVNTYQPDLANPAVSESILQELSALPGYFAAEKNKWHEAAVREILQLTRQSGQDVYEDYFVPRLYAGTLPNLLYLEPSIAANLEQRISAGLERQTIETRNPFITGFFKYKLNHEAVSIRTQFDPRKLPSQVFSEEWNCYNALTVYGNLVDEQPVTPFYTVVALCRDMKKFLGAMQKGILEKQVVQVQAEARLVYRYQALEVPQKESDDETFIELLRVMVESNDPGIDGELARGYEEILKEDIKTVKNRVWKVSLPLSERLKEQLFQLTAGAVEYYKNLKEN
jgi:hypothetical protein